MNEQTMSGASIHVKGEDGEEVSVGPMGIHVKDGESDVKVSFSGIQIRAGKTNLNICIWKPLVGVGVGILIFVALLTAVVVGIVKLMM